MDRDYDRDYSADFADTHQVPVEPMGMWGLSERSRRWARQEDRWGTSERSRRRGGWRGEQRPGPEAQGPWGPGDRDFERERGWRQVDRESGLGWQRPGRERWRGDWNRGGERLYDRDYAADFPERPRDWSPRGTSPRRSYGADFTGDMARSGRGYSREYGRLELEARGRNDIPWDIDRPSLERPLRGYPQHEAADAWGVYRPAWFGGGSPGEDRERNRGAWSYRASRRNMYEATGARSRPVNREDRPGGYRPNWRRGRWPE